MFLLLFARGCDFYSTSLWIFQEGGLEHETNPLTQIFGVGWNGLVMVNVIVITLISYCFYIYTFSRHAGDWIQLIQVRYHQFLPYDLPLLV